MSEVCDNYRDHWVRSLDGGSTPDPRHLVSCEACREWTRMREKLWRAELPGSESEAPRSSGLRNAIVGIAAAVAIGIAVWLVVGGRDEPPKLTLTAVHRGDGKAVDDQNVVQETEDALSTGETEDVSFSLIGPAKLSVDEPHHVKLPNGIGRFEILSESGQAQVVSTPLCTVESMKCSVTVDSATEGVRVSVHSGGATVRNAYGYVELKAGDACLVKNEGPPVRIEPEAVEDLNRDILPHARTFESLYLEALRLQTEDRAAARASTATDDERAGYLRNLQEAMAIYQELLADGNPYHGSADQRFDAMSMLATSYEDVEINQLSKALLQWKLASKLGASAERIERAEEKVRRNSIDVLLARIADRVNLIADLQAKGELETSLAVDADDAIKAMRKQIVDKGTAAAYGLTHGSGDAWSGVGHPDGAVRSLVADMLLETADEAAVLWLIDGLSHTGADVVAGCSAALERIGQTMHRVRDLQSLADAYRRDSATLSPDVRALEISAGLRDAILDYIAKVESRIAWERRHLPLHLDTAPVTSKLQSMSAHPGAEVRARAARCCGWLGDATLVPLVRPLLEDTNSNVRLEAVRVLGEQGDVSSRATIEQILLSIGEHSDDPAEFPNSVAVRVAAAVGLERLDLVASTPALIEALDDQSVDVRVAVESALTRIVGRDFEIDLMKRASEQPGAWEKIRAVWRKSSGADFLLERFDWALRSVGEDPRWLLSPGEARVELMLSGRHGPVEGAVSRESVALREVVQAIQSQAELLDRDAWISELKRLLLNWNHRGGGAVDGVKRHSSEARRLFVARCLAGEADPSLIAETIKVSLRERPYAGAAVCDLLASVDRALVDDGARLFLTQALIAPNSELRKSATWAMAVHGFAEFGRPLVRRYRIEKSPRVQGYLLWALTQIDSEDGHEIFEQVLVGETGFLSDAFRALAATAIASSGNLSVLDTLVGARDERNDRVAASIAASIRFLGTQDPSAVSSTLIALSMTEPATARVRAALAMGDLDPDNASPEIRERLTQMLVDLEPPIRMKDESMWVRQTAASALGRLGGDGVVTTLLYALEDHDPLARGAAHAALSTFTGKDLQFDANATESVRVQQIEQIRDALAQ